MEDLKLLKAQRAQIKRAVTRHRKFLESLKEEGRNMLELKERKEKLAHGWEEFNTVQMKIEMLEEGNEDSDAQREEFENNYFEIMAGMDELLRAFESTTNATQHLAVALPREEKMDKVKLPPIEIGHFSGKYEEWVPFYQLFKTMVHENNELGDLQKLHYLRSALTGSAADVISALELTPENYLEAWSLLVERFDNRRLIIQTHIKAIFESQNVLRDNSASLRNFVDHFKRHFRALKALKSDAVEGSDLLVYFVLSKMDMATVREWENRQSRESKPTIQDLLDFLTHKCETLELLKRSSGAAQPGQHVRKVQIANASTLFSPRCPMCKQGHLIMNCEAFKALSPDEKFQKLLDKGLCMNCLKSGSHLAKDCVLPGCKNCRGKHHTLLHERFAAGKAQNITSVNYVANPQKSDQIVLSTVMVEIFNSDGKKLCCRALLDSGSQMDFITENLARKLKLKREKLNVSVVGIGQKTTQGFERVEVNIRSRIKNYGVTLKPLILERITEALPIHTFDKKLIKIPKNIVLADPDFNCSREIDILIGSHHFWDCLKEKSIQVKGQPRLQETKFGWVVAGGWRSNSRPINHSISNVASIETADLTKFWEIENIGNPSEMTIEEKYCVQHFERTYKRDDEGRFIVELPIKQEKLSQLGNNKEMALKRFYNLENKLNKRPQLKEDYVKFMREYEELGHMAEVKENSEVHPERPQYFIPHHCVLNENSLTTKLRVVFGASSKMQSSLALNEVLMTGPVLQQELFSILTRFRTFKYVLTADIRKMYRQIKVAEHQTDLQKIFWRESPKQPIKTYKLLTVTYGTSSASFLAIKAVQELAKLEGQSFPLGAMVALRDFYVDDLITGAGTKEELSIIKNEIIALLKRGGMELAKWCTNTPELLLELEPNVEKGISFDKDSNFRTLGVKWWPVSDEFGYTVQGSFPEEGVITKRKILSSIARIFDPLGLVGPYVVTAKILLQRLWELKLGWDEEAPLAIQEQWGTCRDSIRSLQNVRIPRLVCADGAENIELHGFSDASESAYGACLYVRSVGADGVVSAKLLCAKSRVAPIKVISLPRLELCAAVLLTKLVEKVKASLAIYSEKVFCWTDSKIVLAWIRSNSKKWSVFVAHRVGTIQDTIPADNWRHVPSEDNPADLVSRGCPKGALETLNLWWHGPEWLNVPGNAWPQEVVQLSEDQIPELKKVSNKVVVKEKLDIFNKYGTYKRMVRVVAYLQRFMANCKRPKEGREVQPLTSKDFENAEKTLVKRVQSEEYSEELNFLRQGKSVPRGSKLTNLMPFLDESGLIRVGGRLQNADLPFAQKHPIVIPGNHSFTKLLLIQEHERLLHTGAHTTLASIRERFWPVAVKSRLKALIYNCVRCRKAAPIAAQYVMGNLPKERTSYSKAFETSGVDYCGPFLVKESKRRNSRTNKIWVAVFVCLSVKAVHLEIATDLTAEGFLHALQRFIARRGMVRKLYSDNATNFAAASKELHCIEWSFIPPRAPHFGGLWEAAVKAFKTHFKRVVDEKILTYEEFNTLLISIEAVLNSRPLIPLSDDITDYSALTPAHFLIGNSLSAIPTKDETVNHVKYGRRWQWIQQLKEWFWKRWHTEYLRACQPRGKWTSEGTPVVPGQLVMVLEDAPTGKVVMGRITEIFRGGDGVARVVKVRTASGEFKRPVRKIAALPIPFANSEPLEDGEEKL